MGKVDKLETCENPKKEKLGNWDTGTVGRWEMWEFGNGQTETVEMGKVGPKEKLENGKGGQWGNGRMERGKPGQVETGDIMKYWNRRSGEVGKVRTLKR